VPAAHAEAAWQVCFIPGQNRPGLVQLHLGPDAGRPSARSARFRSNSSRLVAPAELDFVPQFAR
jgi:hypothetical protein